jgi:hypothetical protein
MALIYSKLKAGVTKVKIEIVYSGTNPVLAGYEYQLKEKNSNAILDDKEGDNQNSQDDIYWLPTPITDNIGRKVLLTSKIAALDKDAEYEVKMKVLQDDINTDTLISVGKVRADGEAALSFDIIKFI